MRFDEVPQNKGEDKSGIGASILGTTIKKD
jgi:hypothetical protein